MFRNRNRTLKNNLSASPTIKLISQVRTEQPVGTKDKDFLLKNINFISKRRKIGDINRKRYGSYYHLFL